MSYSGDMVDDLRDRLNDATDTQVPFVTKVRFLNRGLAAMFPRIYQVMRDTTLTLQDGVFEYTLPAGIGQGKVLTVEVESDSGSARYTPLTRYDLIPSISAPTIVLLDNFLPSALGAHLRVTTAERLTPFTAASYAVSQSEEYSGPTGTEELPVLYAMGLITARPLDDRMDYRRYAATQQPGAIGPTDIMQVSQFWFSQFEILLDRLTMPFPVSRA
jgi:hypothetical protein